MFKKLLTSACLCFIALWAGTATAREITFDLLSDKGPATHKSWPGKHLLLAFGYTTCPEICPTTLYEFAEAMKELKTSAPSSTNWAPRLATDSMASVLTTPSKAAATPSITAH